MLGAEAVRIPRPQYKLITSVNKYPAMVAGFGAGKTEALVTRAIILKMKYKPLNFGYYMPTFDLVRQIAWPRFEEKLEFYKIFCKLNKNENMLNIRDGGSIIFRTMDTPARIIGFEVADSCVDELDTLKEIDARNVWRRILARNRQKKPDKAKNTVAVGTTPEGFRFVYLTWKKDVRALEKGYELIHASTYSNAHNLPDDYIQSLIDNYPSNLIQAYLEGLFVNLTSGSVYPEYSRTLNACDTKIICEAEKKDMLHVGMDFNVGKMAAVIFVKRNSDPHAVAEITNVLDTPAMISAIKKRFPLHTICIYPDASGQARKSNNASVSDLSLLREAKFYVYANTANPAVKDRVLSVNAVINSGKGRRLKVNVDACPNFVEALEKQVYDKYGEPDKTSGLDHSADAGGYFLCHEYPVLKRTVQRAAIVGI